MLNNIQAPRKINGLTFLGPSRKGGGAFFRFVHVPVFLVLVLVLVLQPFSNALSLLGKQYIIPFTVGGLQQKSRMPLAGLVYLDCSLTQNMDTLETKNGIMMLIFQPESYKYSKGYSQVFWWKLHSISFKRRGLFLVLKGSSNWYFKIRVLTVASSDCQESYQSVY